jgi:hypothetical protein
MMPILIFIIKKNNSLIENNCMKKSHFNKHKKFINLIFIFFLTGNFTVTNDNFLNGDATPNQPSKSK